MNLNRLDPSALEPAELDALQEVAASPGHLRLTDDRGNGAELPPVLARHLRHVLDLMRRRQTVMLIPEDERFTTQAAADYLGCSRQHLVDLLERGEIPFDKVGTHRRVTFRDLRAYAKQRDACRKVALDD